MFILLAFGIPLSLGYVSMIMLKLSKQDKKFMEWVNK
jgi:hypothetical protein